VDYKIIGNGKEVLVIETGLGGSFYDWYPFVEKIKDDFKVVLYSRRGYGKSPDPDCPRTTRNIANELESLLVVIGISDKFILMGHSFGGLCAQHYARLFPNRIKGLVLVDATSPNYKQLYTLDTPNFYSKMSFEKLVEMNLTFSRMPKDELKEQLNGIITSYRERKLDSIIEDVVDFFGNPRLFSTVVEELKNWEVDSEDIKSIAEFPNVPLIVIARDNKVSEASWVECDIPLNEAEAYEAKWRELQQELSELSVQGKLVIAENSDHGIYLDRPDLVIEALEGLIT